MIFLLCSFSYSYNFFFFFLFFLHDLSIIFHSLNTYCRTTRPFKLLTQSTNHSYHYYAIQPQPLPPTSSNYLVNTATASTATSITTNSTTIPTTTTTTNHSPLPPLAGSYHNYQLPLITINPFSGPVSVFITLRQLRQEDGVAITVRPWPLYPFQKYMRGKLSCATAILNGEIFYVANDASLFAILVGTR